MQANGARKIQLLNSLKGFDMYGYIYKITNLYNGMVYIGQTTDYNRRMRQHNRTLKRGAHHNILLQKDYDRYGEDVFLYEIIDEAEEPYVLDSLEIFWLDAYGGYKSKGIYNTVQGGSNDSVGVNNPRARSVMCLDTMKVYVTAKDACEDTGVTAAAISGCCHGYLISAHGLHWCFTDEYYDGILDDILSKPRFSNKRKQEMSKRNTGAGNPNAHRVYCIELDMMFNCMNDAAEYIGVAQSTIKRNCQGKTVSVKGYHFLYEEDVCEENIQASLNRKKTFKTPAIPCRCIELDTTFASRQDAGNFVNRTSSAIGMAIKDGNICAGYHWENVE